MFSHNATHDDHITSDERDKLGHISITSNLDLNQISTQSTTNGNTISFHTTQLGMGTSSSMKTAIDNNTTARTTNATNIATNTASITTLNNAFPQETNLRHYALNTGDIYNDGYVKFYWNASQRQLMFWVLNIPASQYMVGGVERWVLTGIQRTANYISQNNSTYYHYFTGPQLGGAVLNTSYNLTSSYARAVYFLTPYNYSSMPSYEIKVLVGYSAGYHTINIKRFN